MNLLLLIPLVILFFLLFIIIKLFKEKNKLQTYVFEIANQRKEAYEREIEEKYKSLKEEAERNYQQLENRNANLQALIDEKARRYEEINDGLVTYRNDRLKDIEKELELQNQVNLKTLHENYGKAEKQLLDEYAKVAETAQIEISAIKEELSDLRSKRAAINEEIRIQDEKENYNQIHSVNLTNNEKEDILFLLSLEDKIHNKQILYKLIWSQYLQPAYKTTFNNILGSRNPKNVIYCIENVKTNKKYIGKTSAEVSKRWTEHIKTSLNIGTIKSTKIHNALYKHWDDFIFYIITETDKDKLSELEKYYINFYETDKYGYNIKSGG